MKELIDILAEYGLSDKEASVYLAMLELGPASVQDISKKAGVNRATTYVMIEALKRRGLMSTFDKGKKTMFVAESPERLKRLSEAEVHAAQEKGNRLKDQLPSFLALFSVSSQEKPNVRFFEGEEGFRTTRELNAQARGEVLSFLALDEATLELSRLDESRRLQLNERLHGRSIVAIKQGTSIPVINRQNWEVREIPYEIFPFSGEILFFDEKVSITITKAKPIVFLIENKETSLLLRAMFEAIWRNAKPWPVV